VGTKNSASAENDWTSSHNCYRLDLLYHCLQVTHVYMAPLLHSLPINLALFTPFPLYITATLPLHTKHYLFVFLLNNTDLNTFIHHVSPPYSSNGLMILLSFHRVPIWQSRHESKGSVDLALLLKTLKAEVIAYLQKHHSSKRKCCHFKVR
jgi:hypothetical protein